MKALSRLIAAAVLLALTAALVLLAKYTPDLFSRWYPGFSQGILGAIGSVSEQVRLPLWEIGVAALVVLFVFLLVRAVKKKRFFRWVANLVLLASFLLCSFVAFWGAGHMLPTLSERIVTLKDSTAAELYAATAYYAACLDAMAPEMTRDAEGKVLMGEFEDLVDKAEESFESLAEHCPVIPEADFAVKELLVGDLFGYMGITGVFVPVTAESTVSPHTYPSSLPYTICHEMGHRVGACAEEDANFLAFLACVEQEDPRFRYSAAFNAFIYCYNALYEISPPAAGKVWKTMTPLAQSDVALANAHYEPYEGKVQEAAQKVNDTYLKTAGQEAGVRSYGLVSDALIAWYRENVVNLKNNA